MDPRGRKKLDTLIRTQGKKETSLQALNVFNLDSLCCFHLSKYRPNLYSLISSLKERATLLKGTFDELCLDDFYTNSHPSLSSYNLVIRDIPQRMVFNTPMEFIDCQHNNCKCSETFSKKNWNEEKKIEKLMKHMIIKFDFLLDDNLLNYYITHVIRDCHLKKWRISNDLARAQNQLQTFLRVCSFFPPQFEIHSTNSVSFKHYSLFANLLKFCYNLDLQDSGTVMKIFIILLKMHLTSSESLPSDRQPQFPKGILKYILLHGCRTKTNLQSYISSYCNTIWNFRRNFSVLESVVKGDEETVLELLKAGFDVFPEEEQKEISHEFPVSSDVLSKPHKMILFIMKEIESHWDCTEPITISQQQKECFSIFCRHTLTTYVSKKELKESISAEYEHLLSKGVEEALCRDRKRKLTRSANLYAKHFPEMTEEAKKPRSLQDLSKISLRNSFSNVQKNTTTAPSIVREMHQDFTFFEDKEFQQTYENYATRNSQ